MKRTSAMLAATVVAAVSLLLMGCAAEGPETVDVQGTLTVGGQPVSNVLITFAPVDPKTPAATGMVTDGKFILTTGVQGVPGAMPGKYKVVLAQQAPAMSSEEAAAQYSSGSPPPKAPELSFPAKYSQASTSDKEVEVTASGPNDIVIEL